MTEQPQIPLVSSMSRRGWRAILRFRSLNHTPHVALVITRRGRLAGVIPADGRRVLSDYITWPYDFREVDMRERLLLIQQRTESCDAGYEFDVTLKLTYQVERPERVALELEDALAELEQALAQSVRVTSRSFGVERAKVLEENLREALLYGDVLRERLEALGLAPRRADVAVELDQPARARAEALRDQMRERPLLAQAAIESLDPQSSFDALVGGSYRLTSRVLMITPSNALDSAVHGAIIRTLQGSGISFAPQDYQAAAQAMTEALRHDALLQAELGAAAIELIRPTVKIQPDRQMVMAASQAPLPALPAPAPALDRRSGRSAPLLMASDPPPEPDDMPPWASLGAAFGRERPLPASAIPAARPSSEEAHAAPGIGSSQQPDADRPDPLTTTAAGAALDTSEYDAPGWSVESLTSERAESDFAEPHALPPSTEQEPAPQPDSQDRDPPADDAPADDRGDSDEQVQRWIALFEAAGPALLKLRTLELMEQPEALPAILAVLTDDPAARASAGDPRHQHALIEALAARSGYATPAPLHAPRPFADLEPAAAHEAQQASEPVPDWCGLRRSLHDDGGAA